MFLLQFVVMMGLFFVVPLFLSVALGLSAIETGLRITPLSVTMLLAAAGVPKLFPTTSPRRIVTLGFVAVLVGIVVLSAAMDVDANGEHRHDPDAGDRAGIRGARIAARCRHRGGRTREAAPRSAGSRTPPRSSARRSERPWRDRSSSPP